MSDDLKLKEVAESFLIAGTHPNLRMVAEAALRADKLQSQNQALQEERDSLHEDQTETLRDLAALQEENERLLIQGELWQQRIAALQERIEELEKIIETAEWPRDSDDGRRLLADLRDALSLSPTQETEGSG
jgi:FtsZ-binding cell division protein ZapB